MPLFARWRHPPYAMMTMASSANGVGKGCSPSSSSHFFCAYDEGIEGKLVQLHQISQQTQYKDGVQAEIDTYLFACISPELRHLILPRNNVPHYDNLPDISAYALGIIDPALDSAPELQQVLLLLRQCTPLRRRTKRAQREVQWREESSFAMQTLLRCMQGTLLGLYPNCLKAIAFGARLGLLRFLRTVLVQPFERMHACMQRIQYITKLSVMEHLCNTIYDYHPGICHTLNRSGQKVEHFCNSVSTICDIFRGEFNTLYCTTLGDDVGGTSATEAVLRILPRMERIAHSYFERCTRAYRGIIIGAMHPQRSIDAARRLLTAPHSVRRALEGARVACNQNVFEATHQHIMAPSDRELAWHLTQVVQVHALPRCIAERQRQALERRYNGDTACIEACRLLHLCVQCVVRKGSAQGIRLRHDCQTGELVCVHCGQGTVLTINMMGCIATVAKDRLLLSSCCGSFVYYAGTGHEYARQCGAHCGSQRQLFSKRERSAAGAAPARPAHCFVCNHRNGIQQTLQLLDPSQRAMVPYSLCGKHVVPQHIANTLYDQNTLLLYFRQRQQRDEAESKAPPRKKKSPRYKLLLKKKTKRQKRPELYLPSPS